VEPRANRTRATPRAVVSRTDRTSPIAPTRVRTSSSASTALVRMVPSGRWEMLISSSTGQGGAGVGEHDGVDGGGDVEADFAWASRSSG
jgi:hypothetical protein